MKEPRLEPDSPAHGVISYDARIAADTDVSASSYASTVSQMPVESLEVREQPVKAQVSVPMTDNRFKAPFSRRKAAVVSVIITVLVILLTVVTLAILSREAKQPNATSRLNLNSQDIQLKNQSNATAPAELQGVGSAVLINGDLVTRGQLKVTNGAYVTVLRSANLTSNRNLTLPNASGTLCVDSNNCGYATTAQLQDLQSRLGQVVVPVVPDATTVNGQGGAVSVQGTSNQISVTTANGVIALSTPQDIAPISSPTFANLLLNGNFSVAGTVTLPLNCSGMLNGGALTTNASGQIICSGDDSASGGGGSAVTTAGGTAGNLALFTAADTIADSIISQALGAITIGGNTTINGTLSANSLTLATALSVANGGTGATTFTTNGVLVGNGTGAVTSTTAPTGGQVLLGNASNVPQFTTVSGDVAITAAGVTAIQADSVALGVDTTGNYVANLGTLTGLTTSGNTGEGSTPTLSVVYGSVANTAVQGNTSISVNPGTNLTGGGTITLGSGGTVTLNVTNSPTFSGNIIAQGGAITIGNTSGGIGNVVLHDGNGQIGSLATTDLTSGRTYTFPNADGVVCLNSGNCVGGTGGAPNGATYLTIGNDSTLNNERSITAGTNIGFADGGANGLFTISTVNNPNFSTSVTTPLLQSSGALSITPSGALTVGATGQTALLQGSATTITSNGAGNDIVLTSADQITLTGFNCTTFANGGVLTTDASGNIVCANDDGGAGGAITGTGTANRLTLFTGSQSVADSWLLQNGSTLELDNTRNLSLLGGNFSVTGTGTFSGLLTANGSLTIESGDTFTMNGDAFTDLTGTGLVISSGSLQTTLGTSVDLASEVTGTLGVTNGGTGVNGSTAANGQLLIGNGTGYTLATLTQGDGITITNAAGSITVANAFGTEVDLGVETAGNYQASTTAGNGISVSGTAGEGWTATVALGALTANWDQTGAFDIVLNNANSELRVLESAGGTFFGTIDVGDLTADRTYTFPNASGTVCLDTGNCAGAGGGITGAGTADTIAKFTGAGTIGDSSISDNGSVVTLNGTANLVIQGGTATFGTTTQAGTLTISDGSSNTVSIVASAFGGNYTYTLPDVGGAATFCMSTGNCVGGGGGGAPNAAAYLVASLDGTLTNERALNAGSNISLTDGGAGSNFTVATVQNPTFTTSVTTPQLQSSGALTLVSAAGEIIAVDAGTTIELQDSTNVTGSLDVSVALNVGTGNAFQVNSSGAISAATGITSSGTVTFSALNCTTFTNGGKVTTNGSGQLTCANDNGAAANTITGTGTNGTLPMFTATNVIADSIVTQSGTTVNIAGDLTLSTDLAVVQGGTGAGSFTSNGVLYGNGTGALQVTAAGTSGQVLVANASGVPTFVSFSGDVTVSDTGVTSIAADSVALGTDTTGNYVANLGTLTGLTTSGNTGEGSTPTLSVTYGSGVNTAVQGNTTLTCPSGTGNLSGGGTSITLGTGGTCGNLDTVANPTFSTSITTPLVQSSGALSITSLGALTLGSTAQAFTLQGNASSTITATGGDGFATTVGFIGTATGAVTYNFDRATTPGTYTVCTTAGNCTGTAVTLQSAYNNSTNPEIVVDSTRGALTVRDNATPLSSGARLLEVQSNNGSVTYFGVNAAGASITGNLNIAGTGASSDVALTVRGNGAQGGGDLITDFQSYDGVTTKSILRVTNDAGLFIGNNTGTAARFGISNGSYYGTLQTTNLTQSRTYELPDVNGTICTTAGNCGATTGTLQNAYDYSVGGTTPEFKLDNTRTAIDIQDADTTLGSSANFMSFRAPNASGLGSLLVGFGLQGNLYMNPSTDRTDFWDINNQAGNNLLTLDSVNGRLGLNLGGSTLPSYTLDVGGTARVSGATLIQPGANIANALDVKNDVGTSIFTVDTNVQLVRVSGAGTDAGVISGTGAIQIGADNGTNLAFDNNEIMARNNGAAATLFLQQEGGTLNSRANSTIFRNFADSTTALQVQNANGNAILTVDTTNRGVGVNGGATGALTVSSDLSLGARSSSLLSVTQANDATNNSTAPLVSFTNSDTASGVSVLDLSQGNGNATALQLNANLNSGNAIRISGNGSNTPNANVSFATGSSPFSGSYIAVNPQRHLTSGAGTYTESGSFLSLSRSNYNDTASGTYAITGDLATLSSNCTQNTGTCTDTSSILNLNQQYASASGAVLKVQGAGTGYLVQVTDTTATAADVFTIANEGAAVFTNRTNSATAFRIQDSAAANLFTVDTTARSGSGGNLIKIGNSTGTDGALTILQVDSATADPTSNLAALNGGLFYNSTTNKLSIIENGQVKIICNTTDLGCGTGTITLQSAYNNSTNPEITLGSASTAGLTIRDNSTPISGNLLEVQNNGGGTTHFAVNSTGTSVGGTLTVTGAATFNAGLTVSAGQNIVLNTGSGQLQFDTDGEVYIRENGSTDTDFMELFARAGFDFYSNSNQNVFSISQNGRTSVVSSNDTFGGLEVLQSNTNPVLTVSAAGSEGSVKVGYASDIQATLFILDNDSTTDPTGVEGGMYYNNSTNKFRCYQNTSWVDCISPTGASTTLQQAYDFSSNPEIVLDGTRGALTVRDNATPLGANLLEVQNNAGSTTYLSVASTGLTVNTALSAGAGGTGNSITNNISTTSGMVTGNRLDTALNPASNSSADIIGTSNTISTSGTANFSGDLIASLGQINWAGSGTSSDRLIGSVGKVVASGGSGAIQNAVGVMAEGQFQGGAVTNYYGLYSTMNSLNNVAIQNAYGLKIDNFAAIGSAAPTNFYAIAADGGMVRFTGNSAYQFQIQNAALTPVLNVDTTTTNLVSNPSIEVDTTGWSASGGATISRSAAITPYDANFALRVNATAVAGDGARFSYNLAGSTQYTFSFFAKAAAGNGFATLAAGRSDNGSTDTACTLSPDPSGFGAGVNDLYWKRYTCTFTTGAVSGARYVYIKQTDATARTFYIDAVQLETGASATMYRSGKTAIGGNLVVNGGQPEAGASDVTLKVNVLAGGHGLIIKASGANDLFKSLLDVRNADDTISYLNVNEVTRGTSIRGGNSAFSAAALEVTSIQDSAVALRVNAASGQTADIFQVYDAAGTPNKLFSVGMSSVTLGTNLDLLLQGASAYISNPQGQTASEAFGLNASAGGANAVVVGNGATGHASGGSTAIGASASAGTNAVAIGYSTDVQANAVAIGYNAFADSSGISIGRDAQASTNSIAIGRDAVTTANNQLVIGSENSTQFINHVVIGDGVTSATPNGFTLQGTSGSGTNIAGASVDIAGGQGTGSAAGGAINLQVSAAGASGASLNSLATVATFSSTSVTLGHTANTTAINLQSAGTTLVTSSATALPALKVQQVANSTTGGHGLLIMGGTSPGEAAFEVRNSGNTAIFSVDTSNSRTTVGSGATCTGRLCVGQSSSGAAGGATTTNLYNIQNINISSGTPTYIGQSIVMNDTSSAQNTTLRPLVLDTTGSTNTSATVNSIQAMIRSGAAGTFMQLQNGSTDVVNIANSGDALFRTTAGSVSAFQIQNASSTPLFKLDTTYPVANQVTNGGFESNTTGWTARSGTTGMVRNTSHAQFGLAGMSFDTNASGEGVNYVRQLSPSTQYTISFYSKNLTSSTTSFVMGYAADASTETNVGTSGYLSPNLTSSTAGWTKHVFTLTTGASVNASAYLFIKTTSATARTFVIDGVQIVSGPYAGAYREGTLTLDAVITSPLQVQTTTDSESAFSVNSSTGIEVLNVNTLHGTVSVNTSSNVARFNVNTGSETGIRVTQSGAFNLFQLTDTSGVGTDVDVFTVADDGVTTIKTKNNSATAFQVQDSASASLFTVDTTARSASGGNLIKIGNSTGTDTDLTILKLDSATADPTSNLAALSGGLYYNSTTNKVQIIENGVVKELCNKVDTGCGAAGPSLGKNLAVNESSTSNFAGTMYTFTQQNTGAAGVLSLANAGTSSTLRVTSTGNATTNNALLFGQLTNASISGNLLDLRSGTSGSETSKFTVSALGATAVQGTVTVTGLAGASGTSGTSASDVMNVTGGTGGAATTGTGGAGGKISLQTGTGGDSDNTAGNGGLFTVQTGAGGSDNSGAGVAGNGGNLTLNTGAGGSSNGGNGGAGGTITLQAGAGGFSTTADGSGGDIVLKPGAPGGVLGNYGKVQIGSSTPDNSQYNLVVDATNTTVDSGVGINGAIYYNAGGRGGADGGSVYSGKFRCREGNIWKNCIGMRDIVERRWGYAVPQGLGTALSADGLYTSTILGAASDGAIANSPQAESNYISYSTGTTSGQKGGIGYSHSSTAMQSRWLPKLVTRIRVDSTSVASARYWVALAGNTLAGSSPTATSGAFATAYMGVAVDSGVNSSKFICGSGDGTTHSGTDMGVTVTAGHYYDVIVDYSTSGTLVCSVADNGGAFTTVTKTTNLPSTSTSLGVEETVTTLSAAIRAIHIAYSYLEFQ